MKKILVTGSTGFVGSHLVEFLLKEKNHKIQNFKSKTKTKTIDKLWQLQSQLNKHLELIYFNKINKANTLAMHLFMTILLSFAVFQMMKLRIMC